MSINDFIPDAFCGLYCAACPNYMKTQANPDAKRVESTCKGCKSDTLCTSWCDHCNLKACAKLKAVAFCYQCKEYPCDNLQGFKNDSNYPYHDEIYEYLDMIKIKGKVSWLKEMKKRWSCSACGMSFHWWTQTCTKCGRL